MCAANRRKETSRSMRVSYPAGPEPFQWNSSTAPHVCQAIARDGEEWRDSVGHTYVARRIALSIDTGCYYVHRQALSKRAREACNFLLFQPILASTCRKPSSALISLSLDGIRGPHDNACRTSTCHITRPEQFRRWQFSLSRLPQGCPQSLYTELPWDCDARRKSCQSSSLKTSMGKNRSIEGNKRKFKIAMFYLPTNLPRAPLLGSLLVAFLSPQFCKYCRLRQENPHKAFSMPSQQRTER